MALRMAEQLSCAAREHVRASSVRARDLDHLTYMGGPDRARALLLLLHGSQLLLLLLLLVLVVAACGGGAGICGGVDSNRV